MLYKKNGAIFFNRRLHPYAVQDGLLITGQNPASSKLVAEKLLHQLNTQSKMLNFELYNPTNLVFGRANRKTRNLVQRS
jgi:hypothetical protein